MMPGHYAMVEELTYAGGKIYLSDCVDMSSVLRGKKVDLVYMDPPFFTQRTFVYNGQLAFADVWKSRRQYLEYIESRAAESRQQLSDSGSFVLHCDPTMSHYLKIMLDHIFGAHNFESEIIWRYRRWPTKTSNFQRMHDVLLRYVRYASKKPTWNQLYEPLAPSTVATFGTKKQRANFVGAGIRSSSTTGIEESPGVPMGDVWDIGVIAPLSKERTGYPTQKPEKLLERLILATTNPGDTVLDPMFGSGTTLAVAKRLGRRFVGFDSSAAAFEVTQQRLRGVLALPEHVR